MQPGRLHPLFVETVMTASMTAGAHIGTAPTIDFGKQSGIV